MHQYIIIELQNDIMTYKIKIYPVTTSKFCDVFDENNDLVYSVKSEGIFNSNYGVYKNNSMIANIECEVKKHNFNNDETSYDIFAYIYKNDVQVANMASTMEFITKKSYTIGGFEYKFSSNLIGTHYEVKNRDKEIIGHVDTNIASSNYVLNVQNHAGEDILLSLLMILIYQKSDPNSITNSIIDNIVGNSFKMD